LSKLPNSERYELKMEANSRIPIDRFVIGLKDEISEIKSF